MRRSGKTTSRRFCTFLSLCVVLAAGCEPIWYWRQADKAATGIIAQQQHEAFGESSPFTIERPVDTLRRRLMVTQDLPRTGDASLGTDQLTPIDHWPAKARPDLTGSAYPDPSEVPVDGAPLVVTMFQAMQIAAANSRDYQTRKEDVYKAALALDLEDLEFRNTFAGVLDAFRLDSPSRKGTTVRGNEYGGSFDWSKKFKTGAEVTAGLALDLVKLITADGESSFGIVADATISIPLLRGAGRYIVTEPMTQAQRNVVYALYTLERFKKTLAVRVASEFLSVLQQLDQVKNAAENYTTLTLGVRRSRRLADAGRLPEIQVDQARQDELRARERWISAQESYKQRLDRFKITIGMPTDANISLDPAELQRLADTARQELGEKVDQADTTVDQAPTTADAPVVLVPASREDGGRLELPPEEAASVALTNRLDMRTAIGRVFDAQRKVIVAANALKMGLSLTGTGRIGESRSLGSARSPNAQLHLDDGQYAYGVTLDLPLERTAEQNAYRTSFITLEQNVRSVQELEDQIKLEVRDALRTLLLSRESFVIQSKAVTLAERRVQSTALFLQAGRAEVRDVLEAQQSLVNAQDAVTAALVNYRIAELELQRDMGVLEVDDEGLWHEYSPPTVSQ